MPTNRYQVTISIQITSAISQRLIVFSLTCFPVGFHVQALFLPVSISIYFCACSCVNTIIDTPTRSHLLKHIHPLLHTHTHLDNHTSLSTSTHFYSHTPRQSHLLKHIHPLLHTHLDNHTYSTSSTHSYTHTHT